MYLLNFVLSVNSRRKAADRANQYWTEKQTGYFSEKNIAAGITFTPSNGNAGKIEIKRPILAGT